MLIQRCVFAGLLPVLALLAACDAEPQRPVPIIDPVIDRALEIAPRPVALAIGDSVRLTLQWRYTNGEVMPVTTEVAWSVPTEAQHQLRFGGVSGAQATLRALGPTAGRVEARTQGAVGKAEIAVAIAPFTANTPLRFEAVPVEPPIGALPPVRVTAGPGRLEVRGYAEGPCHGARLFAAARREGWTLRLHIAAEAFSPCAGTAPPYEYTAVLDSLPAGSYSLRLTQQQVARGSADVQHQDVMVPGAEASSAQRP